MSNDPDIKEKTEIEIWHILHLANKEGLKWGEILDLISDLLPDIIKDLIIKTQVEHKLRTRRTTIKI